MEAWFVLCYIIGNDFTDEIHIVKDGRYGQPDPTNPSKWNGMIGELLNNVGFVMYSNEWDNT